MVLKILSVEPIYPQYSGILETCLALRYWFFEVLGSESVNDGGLSSAALIRKLYIATCQTANNVTPVNIFVVHVQKSK